MKKKQNLISDDLGGISFGQDTEGNWGYKPSGADTVIPFKSSTGLIIPYLNNISGSYGGTMTMKVLDCHNIKIGSLKISNEANTGYTDNSYFGIFNITDTSLSTPIYKKTRGTSLTNIEIDTSIYDGIIIVLCTSRPSSNNKSMYVTLTEVEIN